jgi:hypothetical protein
MFDTEGVSGYLRVLLEILDQCNIEIKLLVKEFKKVHLEDKLELEIDVFNAEKKVQGLIESFVDKGYLQAAKYLMNAKKVCLVM